MAASAIVSGIDRWEVRNPIIVLLPALAGNFFADVCCRSGTSVGSLFLRTAPYEPRCLIPMLDFAFFSSNIGELVIEFERSLVEL